MAVEGFRLDYAGCRDLLGRRLAEKPPGRIQFLTGPRQVGKTTLLLELAHGMGKAATYVAADGPEAALPGFWERLWARATEQAGSLGKAVLLIDEIHHLGGWVGRLKGEWDGIRRRRVPLQVVATGSSALHLGAGSRESLAGRFERLTLSHWTAAAMVAELRVRPGEAADLLVRFGSYPGAIGLRDDVPRWRAYVRDSIIEPAIGRDILALGVVRRPALLRQVFTACAGTPAQVVSLQKLQGQLGEPGALETVAHYLKMLEEAYLVAPLEKYSTRVLRRRAAPPKLVVLNNALLAATDPRGAPDPEADPARHGAWVENACLAHAWNCGQRVAYWREEPLEVDAVVDGSWGSWAIEVKTGSFNTDALRGLLEFCRRHPRYRPLLLTGGKGGEIVRRLGVASMTWRDYLLKGPPPA